MKREKYETELKKEYESILLKKKKNYSCSFFNYDNKSINQKNALIIIRYALEDFLHWTPKDIEQNLNMEIMRAMKIDTLLKHIEIPHELNMERDLFYIAHLLYPDQCPYNPKAQTIKVYHDVLSRKLYRYPKSFFEDIGGIERAKLCLINMIQNYIFPHNVEELYQLFSEDTIGKTLKKYCLLDACNMIFESPLDFLHESLSMDQKNDFCYQYYKFKQEYQKVKTEVK